jgi:hypothetical protein
MRWRRRRRRRLVVVVYTCIDGGSERERCARCGAAGQTVWTAVTATTTTGSIHTRHTHERGHVSNSRRHWRRPATRRTTTRWREEQSRATAAATLRDERRRRGGDTGDDAIGSFPLTVFWLVDMSAWIGRERTSQRERGAPMHMHTCTHTNPKNKRNLFINIYLSPPSRL